MKRSSLSRATQEKLLHDFCEAFLNIRTTEEALKFLSDLLTKKELITLAKRIQIAKFLLEGKGYRAIESFLSVSHGTIAKVGAWLEESGEGFRLVARRAKKEKEKRGSDEMPSEWSKIKRRYPMMFWPQLLLEDIVKGANKREKERIRNTLLKLEHKTKLPPQFQILLEESGKSIKNSKKFTAT